MPLIYSLNIELPQYLHKIQVSIFISLVISWVRSLEAYRKPQGWRVGWTSYWHCGSAGHRGALPKSMANPTRTLQGFWNWLSGCPGHIPHSCGQVPSTLQLSTGHTLQMICCCCSSKICWWWATSIFGGQVKFEILVAQGQPHHFWISETLHYITLSTAVMG
jgi:hypothetical protein